MQKTKIEWCDSTWNPVTGCLHGCEYCYARRIAERFGGYDANVTAGCSVVTFKDKIGRPYHQVHTGQYKWTKSGKLVDAAYPFGFEPTLYEYKLKEPQSWKKPKTIFVCSMADLFGDWVPDEWIQEVFTACEKAPQHRYLFLTKNSQRYIDLANAGKLPRNGNMWYGTTATDPDVSFFFGGGYNTFLSIEPLLAPFGSCKAGLGLSWIIIGAMTGPGSKDKQPRPEWVEGIVAVAKENHIPVFMKDSLLPIMSEENMRREFPWD